MKKRSQILLGAFTLLGFMACSSNDGMTDKPNPPGEDEVSHISVNINSVLSTRGDGTKEGNIFDKDNVISSIKFYLLNGEGIVKEILPEDDIDAKDEHSVILKSKLVPGDYNLVAITNSTKEYSVGNEIKMDDAQEIEEYSDLKTENTGDNYFLMSSANRDDTGFASGKVTLNYNPIDRPISKKIEVDRAFAAVKVSTGDLKINEDNIVLGEGLELDIADFYVMNVNNKYTLFQNWDKKDSKRFLKTPKTEQYLNGLDQVSVIKDQKVSDIKPGWNAYFSENYQLMTENNTCDFENNFETLQGSTTAVIFRVVTKDGQKGLTATLSDDGNKYTLSVYEEGDEEKENTIIYPNGIFYTYYIKDPNRIKSDGVSDNYHAIVRNTAYDIKLNRIESLGSPYPGGDIGTIDPELPIDESKYSHIDVEVVVNKWIDGEIGIDK